MKLSVNINENVSVKLGPAGERIFREYHNLTDDEPLDSWTYGGYIRIQFWDLMRIFGPHLGPGILALFEGNNIEFDVASYFTRY